jgi:glycogen debranching enzyme
LYEAKLGRVRSLRLAKHKATGPVQLDTNSRELIESTALNSESRLNQCYKEGFGIFPSAGPEESFYNTVWSRDLAHAGGNFFARNNEAALLDSLKTVFRYQRADGSIPYRVERKRFLLEHTFRTLLGIDLNWFKKLGIDLISRKKERPVYEGEDGGNAEDTIPSIIIAVGELFIYSEQGRDFVRSNFESIKRAMDQFLSRTDPADGLETSKKSNPDWSDSLLKGEGKLGTINIWQARAIRMMALMAEGVGRTEEAQFYKDRYRWVKESVIAKLYDREGAYFKTSEKESRIDAAASIFGSLYLLPATEAVRVQETMKRYLKSNSGLRNFYPPYPKNKIFPPLRLIGMGGYHNECVWPWLTAQNIQVKIKIALEHPDGQIREQYKREAVEDLKNLAELFREAGGAYEVFDPDTRKPATKLRTGIRKYKIPRNLMGNLAAYHSAYSQLKELGWI